MSASSLRTGISCAMSCGFLLHFLFHHLEKTHLRLLIVLALVIPLAPAQLLYHVHPTALLAEFISYSVCYTTLFSSIVLYRLSPLHPLSKYPGPVLAKCTKFWGMYQTHTGKAHVKSLELHRRYGPVVRIGPNELSFCDVDVIQSIMGNDGMGKGPMWESRQFARKKVHSLVGVQNVAEHLQRRKLWNKALSSTRVKAYGHLLRKRLLQLVDILDTKSAGKEVVDLAGWLSFFSYDFMGDMAFRAGFELMRDGDKDGIWKIMEVGITIPSYVQHIPWITPFLRQLPKMVPSDLRFRKFVAQIARSRTERGTDASLTGEDLSTHLLDENSPEPKPLGFDIYAAEALLAVVAGSDTAATCMSCTFFYILNEKSLFDRLHEEIDTFFPLSQGIAPHEDTAKLADMPFLNAVINESLRMQPPVPTGLQRAPEPESGGKMVGSIFISEATAVYMPPYAIHRDPRYFSPNPDVFWPDRWLSTTKDVTLNQAAFIPYSTGPMNCVGKALAQVELRAVIATLVQRFDMDLEKGWDRSRWERELEDWFVMKKGVLPVRIRLRGG
ncbi:high nitrogen upregulated cytochrome P450 monooxygenase 2 [Marasmius fiardii PR-910]|nr:high nitrogen upregulated cytochrome P450 monooxygenase 2 [Marasmius fiardii PR-910]